VRITNEPNDNWPNASGSVQHYANVKSEVIEAILTQALPGHLVRVSRFAETEATHVVTRTFPAPVQSRRHRESFGRHAPDH
jgi:hypothetical protein